MFSNAASPSLYTIALYALSLFSSPSIAVPHHRERHEKERKAWMEGRAGNFNLASFNVPLSNGSATLPSPAGKTLVAITLGRGIQNYTCNTTTNTFVSIGAVATLFDTTPLLSTISPAQGQNVLNMLPGYAVTFPLSTIQTNASFAVLGNHFFDASGVPIFDLGSVGVLDGAKAGDIAAPKCAPKGGDGHGAVDWLALTAKPGAASVTLTEGYRVVTAGGKPPSGGCTAPAETQVQYAALYWFFK